MNTLLSVLPNHRLAGLHLLWLPLLLMKVEDEELLTTWESTGRTTIRVVKVRRASEMVMTSHAGCLRIDWFVGGGVGKWNEPRMALGD